MTETSYSLTITDQAEIAQIGPLVLKAGSHLQATEKAMYQFTLALDELITNMFEHGFIEPAQLTVDVLLYVEGDMLAAQTVDNGRPYNCTKAPSPELDKPLEERDKQVGGMGIHLVKNFMDEFSYQRKDDKNFITIKKNMRNNGE